MEPTKQQIHELRQQFMQKLEEEGAPDPGGFHQADLARIANNDDWLRRFLLHHDLDMKEALKMMWETCDWRKKFGCNDITENNVDPLFKEVGGIYGHNRDKDGKTLLIFKCKTHVKGQHDMHELKRYVVYWFERLERMNKGDQISLFFDMADCGIANMDMEFTKYLIGLFKSYYPYYLNYILVYEMAWVLNAAFKIIKSWLPAKAVEKIKFVNKQTLKDFVAPEQALVCWGGLDDFIYTFKSETNGRIEDGRKKVHFAESPNGFGGTGESSRDTSNYMLSISPHETINFVIENGELNGTLTLTNIHNKNVSFKIKTTSPEKFRVRPSMGLLLPQASSTINVLLQPGYQSSALARDKFLIMALPAPDTITDVAELWKSGGSGSQVEQHRLRCNIESGSAQDAAISLDNQSFSSTPDVHKQLSDLTRQVSRLVHGQHELQSSVDRTRTLQYLTLLAVIALTFAVWFAVMYQQQQPEGNNSRLHDMYSESQDSCVD